MGQVGTGKKALVMNIGGAVLWGHQIVKVFVKDRRIVLDSCGYHTASTRNAMNFWLRTYGLDRHYVNLRKGSLYLNGEKFNDDGTIVIEVE